MGIDLYRFGDRPLLFWGKPLLIGDRPLLIGDRPLLIQGQTSVDLGTDLC
ncbi:MAG: hypothetical protein LBQ77_06935 [Treponema sp.]|nr:hypothetical protein [Treponema sp.]